MQAVLGLWYAWTGVPTEGRTHRTPAEGGTPPEGAAEDEDDLEGPKMRMTYERRSY